MRRVLSAKFLLLGLLAACVTVNVYFPAAAAEQAADRIIDTVISQPPAGSSNEPRSVAPPESEPPTSHVTQGPHQPLLLLAAGRLLELLIPAANAQAAPNLEVSDPQIRAVTTSMQQRFAGMKKYFDSGVLGLTADGQIAIREQNSLALADRAGVARLVAEDNRDRTTLYAEIAKANKHPEWEPGHPPDVCPPLGGAGRATRLVLPGHGRQVGEKVTRVAPKAAHSVSEHSGARGSPAARA